MIAIGTYILIRETPELKVERVKGQFQQTDAKKASNNWKEAEIVLVGHTVEYKDTLEAGMKIIFDSVQGHDITISDEKLRLISQRDLALIL